METAVKLPAVTKGAGVLGRASAGWRDGVVVTTQSPWTIARPMMASPAPNIVFVKSLEREHLEELVRAGTIRPIVIGLGSGLAMDAAKYIAWRTGASLIQVPSTVSNNACFTRTCGCLEQGQRAPVRNVPVPEQILIDPDLIRQAPARLNRAGVGEVLCSHTSLVDWELAHRAGRDVDWQAAIAERTRRELRTLEQVAPAIGADEMDGYVALMDIGERFAPEFLAHPKARFNAASEHLFAWCLEQQMGRRLIHGESVCLGILLMAHLQDNAPDWAAGVIRAARVAFRPEQIGTTWDQVERAVLALPDYARQVVPWYSIIDALTDHATDGHGKLERGFKAARAFVEGLH